MAVLIGAFGALVAGMFFLWHSDWIAPGVRAFDIDLGGHSTESAATILTAFWQQQVITLEADGHSLNVPPETLGISFDPEATAQLAHRQGRTLHNLGSWIQAGGHLAVPPVWVFDESQAEANLAAIAPGFEFAPVNASVRVIDARVEALPAVIGRRLDVGATMNQLRQNPVQIFLDGRMQLVTVPVNPAVVDVSAIVQEANGLLSTTVSVRAFDPVNGQEVFWKVAPDIWGKWFAIEINNARPDEFHWTLDSEQTKAFFVTQVQNLGADRYLDWQLAVSAMSSAIVEQNPNVTLRVYHHPTQHIVQPGETFASLGREYGIPYPWIQEANQGAGEKLGVGQIITIPSPDEMLPLPVVEGKRIVVSLSQQQVWVYENGDLKWDWSASTGIDSSPTSPGVFQIQSHEENAYAGNWDLWMPYFMGIYRPVPDSGFMNGFHGFPTRDGANLLWTGNLGHQVTYGCILISTSNATQLYEWAEEGVVVEVQG
jgi:LysM repeat protein